MKVRTGNKPTQPIQETTEQVVQQRAYELFLKRGQEPGHEVEDWLQAEREIREQQERQTFR